MGREIVLQLGRVLDRTRVQFLYKLLWFGSLGYFLIRFFFLQRNKNWKFHIHNPCTYIFNFEN
jgi:hypothetical protein